MTRNNNTAGTRAEAARVQALADGCETAAQKLEPTSRRSKLPAAKGASPVRAIKTTPQAIEAMPAGAIGALPFEELESLLRAAEAQQATKPARQPAAPRVALTEPAREAFAAMGWKAPKVTAHSITQPERRERQNKCKGAAAYTVAVAVLEQGPLPLGDLARLWLASGNEPKQIGAIAQQIANRAQRPVIQSADTLTLG
jgi:hypothetical protein